MAMLFANGIHVCRRAGFDSVALQAGFVGDTPAIVDAVRDELEDI